MKIHSIGKKICVQKKNKYMCTRINQQLIRRGYFDKNINLSSCNFFLNKQKKIHNNSNNNANKQRILIILKK